MTPTELRTYRKSIHLTQEAFATEFRLAVPTIKAWERGVNPVPAWMERMVEFHQEVRRSLP